MLLRCGLRCLTTTAAAAARSVTAMGKSHYAVAVGRKPGLYLSWDQCLRQVKGFPGNRYKGFGSMEEALQYLREHGVAVGEPVEAPSNMAVGMRAAAQDAVGTQGGLQQASGAAAAVPKVAGRKRRGGAPSVQQRQQQQEQHRQQDTADGIALPPTDRVFRLEFDGASKRNPGPAGFGAVLYDDATNVEVARMCQYMGDHHTNNQAEYAGLIAGLAAALELGCRRIRVQGDSTLIIRQVLGEWRVKHEGLIPYHAAATRLKGQFSSFEARQVLREFNKVADALSNQAIDEYRTGVNHRLWRLEEAVAAGAGDAPRAAGAAAAATTTAAGRRGRKAAGAAAAAAMAGGYGEGEQHASKRARIDEDNDEDDW